MKYAATPMKIGISRIMMKSINQHSKEFLNLILPPRCAFSGEIVSHPGEISSDIWRALKFISDPYCMCCGRPFAFEIQGETLCGGCLQDPPEFSKCRAPLVYDDISRSLVLKFKHADQMHIVTTFLPWMIRSGAELFEHTDLILPVPLHRWRLLKRRYNQAAVIAQMLAKEVKIMCNVEALQRQKATVSQGFMKADQRRKNVKDAFCINPKQEEVLQGKNILLIDDVYTTGATVRECARVLLAHGVKEVNVLALAKVVKDG